MTQPAHPPRRQHRASGLGTPVLPLTPGAKPLPPPRYTGSSAAALIQAALALLVAATFALEPPGGYGFPVWDGPRSLVGWLPGSPWAIWAAALAAPALAILAGRGAPSTRWALAVLAGVWAGLGGGALFAGLTDDQAASVVGWLLLGQAAQVIRDAIALSRRRS